MNQPAKRRVMAQLNHKKPERLIRATAFQAVSFHDAKADRQIIVLYSLGSDGIIREFTGGKWQPFPIQQEQQ